MLKLAAIIWIMTGVVLAGSLVTLIVSVPSLYAQGARLIPEAAGAGFVIAVPLSILVARKILSATTSRS